MRRQASLYLIVIGMFMLFISGNFLTEGLARVGVDNAVVSQRMSEGLENFWLPSLNTPGNPDRSNYLPLGYWLESKWYAVFGTNSFLVEKFYSVLIFLILGVLVVWIWKLVGNSVSSGWLPLLCWLTIPLVSWSATSNLLEGTMTIFILLAVAFMHKGSHASFVARTRLSLDKVAGRYRLGRTTWFVLAALMMELAFLVKGFAGLFPLSFPLLYWLIVRRERLLFPLYEMAVILLVWFATLGIIVAFSPEVYNHLYDYLHNQMIGGVLHERTVASHFFILYAFLRQAVIPIAVIALLSVVRIKSKPFYHYLLFWRHMGNLTADQQSRARMGWFYLCLGLSGIVPIMIGLKQQEFYLVPTLPFFAVAMACLLFELVDDWIGMMNPLSRKVSTILGAIVFCTGVVLNLASIQRVSSNQDLLYDMKLMLPCLEPDECVSVSPELFEMPEVEEFFYRYKGITFDTGWDNTHLITLYSKPGMTPDNVQLSKHELATRQYSLWHINKSDN